MMIPPFTFLYLADASVSVFFVLSGYVLTSRFYRTGDETQFQSAAVRRYIRLIIPAAASIFLAWLLLACGAYGNQHAGTLGAAGWVIALYNEPVSFLGAVFRAFLGAPFFGIVDINGPLWTIQIELIGSVLLFGSYALFGKKSLILLSVWFLAFAMVLSGRGTGMLYYISILAGSFLHIVESRLRSSRLLALVCFGIGLIGVSFTYAKGFAPLNWIQLPSLNPYGPDLNSDHRLFWHSLGAVFLVAGVLGLEKVKRWLSMPVPQYLGRI